MLPLKQINQLERMNKRIKRYITSVISYFIKPFIWAAFSFIFLPCMVFSQSKLGLSYANIPDTSCLQTSAHMQVVITNTGNSIFNGSIDIFYATDPLYTPVLITTIPSVTLTPGDTISLITTIFIDSTNFNTGSNIVVVWASSSGAKTSYQAWKTIYVTICPSGINESNYSLHGINAYPNPASSVLLVEFLNLQYDFESVRIWDITGNEIKLSFLRSSERNKIIIDIFSLPPGLYFLTITDTEKNFRKTKFIKYSR